MDASNLKPIKVVKINDRETVELYRGWYKGTVFGLYVRHDSKLPKAVYRTRDYYTWDMIKADIKCWKEFHMTQTNDEMKPEAQPVVHYTVSFVYYTHVADGSTEQRHTTSIDVEANRNVKAQDIINSAWKILTRNWPKPGVWQRAQVKAWK